MIFHSSLWATIYLFFGSLLNCLKVIDHYVKGFLEISLFMMECRCQNLCIGNLGMNLVLMQSLQMEG
jgi:hypothetical protein